MARPNRRSRIISIRVSPEEYDDLMTLCLRDGIGSISNLARKGMKLLVRQEAGNGTADVDPRFDEIDEKMSALDRELAHLTSMLGLSRLQREQFEVRS